MTSQEFQTIIDRLNTIETKKGAGRAWDIAGRILIPLVLTLGAWMVRLEIRTSRLEDRATNMPPQWLKNDVATIKSTLKDIESRLRGLENGKAK